MEYYGANPTTILDQVYQLTSLACLRELDGLFTQCNLLLTHQRCIDNRLGFVYDAFKVFYTNDMKMSRQAGISPELQSRMVRWYHLLKSGPLASIDKVVQKFFKANGASVEEQNATIVAVFSLFLRECAKTDVVEVKCKEDFYSRTAELLLTNGNQSWCVNIPQK